MAEELANLRIRPMTAADWPRVREIYQQGIATANATFETDAPEWEQWDARHISKCRFVATDDDRTVGWAALSPVSARAVYSGVAEVSVYVADRARGHGVGKILLGALIRESEQQGFWTLQAGIFPENVQSIALHKALGFRHVGIRERLGRLGDRWRDVVLMERRSHVAGA